MTDEAKGRQWRKERPQEGAWTPTSIAPDDVEQRAQRVDTPEGPMALIRDGDRIVAIDAWCPHLDGPLWEGSAAGGEVACPWHGWRYSLATGQCSWAPKGDAEEAAETEITVRETRVGPDGTLEIQRPIPPDPAQ